MIKHTVSIWMLLVFAAGCVGTRPGTEVDVYSSPDVLGYCEYVEKTDQQCYMVCPEDRMRQTPEWSEGAQNPPLSPRQALGKAQSAFRHFVHCPRQWDLIALELRQESRTKRWYYKAYYVRLKNRKGEYLPIDQFPPQFGVYILMDGTLVEPVPIEK